MLIGGGLFALHMHAYMQVYIFNQRKSWKEIACMQHIREKNLLNSLSNILENSLATTQHPRIYQTALHAIKKQHAPGDRAAYRATFEC